MWWNQPVQNIFGMHRPIWRSVEVVWIIEWDLNYMKLIKQRYVNLRLSWNQSFIVVLFQNYKH